MAEIKKVVDSVEDVQNSRALMIRFGRLYNFEQDDNFFSELQSLPSPYCAPDGGLFIAYEEGVPAGCLAYLKTDEPNTFILKRLFVLDIFRRKGIATLLVENALADARSLGGKYFKMGVKNWMDGADELCESCQMQEAVIPGISSRDQRLYEFEL